MAEIGWSMLTGISSMLDHGRLLIDYLLLPAGVGYYIYLRWRAR